MGRTSRHVGVACWSCWLELLVVQLIRVSLRLNSLKITINHLEQPWPMDICDYIFLGCRVGGQWETQILWPYYMWKFHAVWSYRVATQVPEWLEGLKSRNRTKFDEKIRCLAFAAVILWRLPGTSLAHQALDTLQRITTVFASTDCRVSMATRYDMFLF